MTTGTPHRVTHLGICVSELDRSVAFYTEALGFTEVNRMRASGQATATILGVPDATVELVYLERDGLRIELIGYDGVVTGGPAPRPMDQVGLTHLSVRVDSVAELARAIVAHGGAVLDATSVVFEWGNRGVMTTDPDGTRIELIERRPE